MAPTARISSRGQVDLVGHGRAVALEELRQPVDAVDPDRPAPS